MVPQGDTHVAPLHHSADRPITPLRLPEVRQRVGFGTSTVYKLIRQGRFPPPVRALGTRTSAWVEGEVDDWIADQVAQRDAAPLPTSGPRASRRGSRQAAKDHASPIA